MVVLDEKLKNVKKFLEIQATLENAYTKYFIKIRLIFKVMTFLVTLSISVKTYDAHKLVQYFFYYRRLQKLCL